MTENGGFWPISEKVSLCGIMITQSISHMVFTLGVVQYIGISQYAAVKVRIVKQKKVSQYVLSSIVILYYRITLHNNVYATITRLVWTIWTPMSAVPKKAVKLTLTHSLTHRLSHPPTHSPTHSFSTTNKRMPSNSSYYMYCDAYCIATPVSQYVLFCSWTYCTTPSSHWLEGSSRMI